MQSHTVNLFSGHSQQRSLSLMWPKLFATAIMNVFSIQCHQRPPLYFGDNFMANRVAILEGGYMYVHMYILQNVHLLTSSAKFDIFCQSSI